MIRPSKEGGYLSGVSVTYCDQFSTYDEVNKEVMVETIFAFRRLYTDVDFLKRKLHDIRLGVSLPHRHQPEAQSAPVLVRLTEREDDVFELVHDISRRVVH